MSERAYRRELAATGMPDPEHIRAGYTPPTHRHDTNGLPVDPDGSEAYWAQLAEEMPEYRPRFPLREDADGDL